ncbi:MADS-box transcription factor 50-like [Elaeis guineensis]|uniref:Agamous-like MADS box protein OPMADS1 n=1 Tax=Elaeis guineensis var. tenera TaxID=51953 RepID=Q9SDT0_ELAGV|nr:MADS-box transcription factor 50-like [Elaeis guineensis]XP_010934010.1 MADS-box transcription factor 50-like isoform X4 [Elaeis guineensis]XP_010934012.1 MADS-box transcription factor 50-like isoform X4 [Elaeis guineensis]XP_029122981.1 MADS-box transcription factor 50-like isoform X4 [Elaeis guineensis]AAF19968.1 agamous-like MADS box protein OPMADS1 [Elaeis guineensis]
MVRGKTEMKLIENATSRQVTFSKRRNGLLKKAFELSVLCDAEVAVIVFSPRGKLYEFSSTSMEKTIDRYRRHAKSGINNNEVTQQWKFEAASMSRKIESLEVSKRKLLGENLESCSAEELHEIEGKIEQSLCHVRGKKNQLLEEQIATLKEQEQTLMEENALLREKCKLQSQLRPAAAPEETVPCSQDGENMEVETELYIGWPGRGRTNCRSQG